MSDAPTAPLRVFISGACAGLAEARDALAAHASVEVVGTASEPALAGTRLATSGAQVVVHALQRPDHLPANDIEQIREHTSAPIVLMTTRSTPTLVEEALDASISDVILLPQLPDQLVFAVRKAHTLGASGRAGARMERSSDRCKVITLFSPKGGTGKTTLAANMAATYSRHLDQRTLLIDLDLQFGDLAIALRSDPRNTILDLVMAHGELDADKVRGFVTHHESGIDLLPAPLRPEDAELVTDDRLASLLTAARQAYDVVIIDTPPNFNSTVLTALDRTDELLLVASLDVPAIKSTKVCLQTLSMLHYPADRCHVILNRSDSKVGITARDVEQVVGQPIRWGIPSNKIVPTSINRGVPFTISTPKADVSRALRDMCTDLMPHASREAPSKRQKRRRKQDASHTQLPAQLELGMNEETSADVAA